MGRKAQLYCNWLKSLDPVLIFELGREYGIFEERLRENEGEFSYEIDRLNESRIQSLIDVNNSEIVRRDTKPGTAFSHVTLTIRRKKYGRQR